MKTNYPSGPDGHNMEWMITAAVAEKYGVTEKTVGTWRKEGMPSYFAGIYLHIGHEVAEWLRNRKRKSRK